MLTMRPGISGIGRLVRTPDKTGLPKLAAILPKFNPAKHLIPVKNAVKSLKSIMTGRQIALGKHGIKPIQNKTLKLPKFDRKLHLSGAGTY